MSKVLNFGLAIAITATISLTAIAAAGAAEGAMEMVVVHVEGAPFKRGTVIDGSRALRLQAGWVVTLVGSDGSFVTLKGPSETRPARKKRSPKTDSKIVEALGALLGADERSTAALGVVRSASARSNAPLPDAWAVNVERSGVRCIAPDVAVLWRSDTRRDAPLSIRRVGGTRTARAVWPRGQELLPLNGKVFRDSHDYAVTVDGRLVKITVNVMPSGLDSAVEQAAWMARSGCQAQAIALIDRISGYSCRNFQQIGSLSAPIDCASSRFLTNAQ